MDDADQGGGQAGGDAAGGAAAAQVGQERLGHGGQEVEPRPPVAAASLSCFLQGLLVNYATIREN